MNKNSTGTKEELNSALLDGYKYANGRGWFSIATHDRFVNVDCATLEHQGYIRSLGEPTERTGFWQWDYEITTAGIERVWELQEINAFSFIAGEK